MINMERYPYKCEIKIDLPSPRHANDLVRILSVDRQVGDRVRIDFSAKDHDDTLQVTVQAETVKLLRVVVSSFYDHLQVVLKCYQEFDETLRY